MSFLNNSAKDFYSFEEAIEILKQKTSDKNIKIVLVGKSGSGKTAAAKYIVTNFKYENIVSHTTRPIRGNETDGTDYYFVTDEEFNNVKMLESTNYRGWKYGISEIEFDKYKHGVIVTDIVGVRNLERLGKEFISIYITRNDKDRFISSIARGDNIMEVALRNERDTACYQDADKICDYSVSNDDSIEELATKILECVLDKYGN